jgi:integrase
MASIQKRGNSYKITVTIGHDVNGKKKRYYKTYTPPEGLSPTKVKKEVNRIAVEFEKKCSLGHVVDSNIKLIDFIELWFTDYANNKDYAPVTLDDYKYTSVKIVEELGHIQLRKLTAKQVQDFYSKIKNSESHRGGQKFKATSECLNMISKLKQKDFSLKAEINVKTLSGIKKGGNTTLPVAKKISDSLEKDFNELFVESGEKNKVSAETVLHYHRLLNLLLNDAVRLEYIPSNPITNKITLPKKNHKEQTYLDDKEAIEFLGTLEEEPLKYKLALNLLLFSGLRRGEIGGLKWPDIDYASNTITIKKALKKISGLPAFPGPPKNQDSIRSIKLPEFIFELFRTYQLLQLELKDNMGDKWHETGYVFTQINGSPMNLDTYGWFIKKLSKKHNLKKVHTHALRHSNATILMASGLDIKSISNRLGHGNISTTMDVYTHFIKSADAKASDSLEDILISPNKTE